MVGKISVDQVKAAIEQGCDPETTNLQGERAVDWIFNIYEEERHRFAVIEILLQADANGNCRFEGGADASGS